MVVTLHDLVAVVADTGFAGERFCGEVRGVAHRKREVKKERPARGLLAPHEVDRPIHKFIVDFGADLWREWLDIAQQFTCFGLDDVRPACSKRVVWCFDRSR